MVTTRSRRAAPRRPTEASSVVGGLGDALGGGPGTRGRRWSASGAAAAARKQRRCELAFELSHLLGDRGLRAVEGARGQR